MTTIALGSSVLSVGQQLEHTDQVYRAAVAIDTIMVTATGPDGMPVVDLTADDFELSIEGAPRDIAFVLNPADVRLEIAVLVDSSSSIKRTATELRPELSGFLSALDTEDCVFVLPFADTVGPGYWNVDVANFVENLVLDGNTNLNDAVISALDLLSPGTSDVFEGFSRVERCGQPARAEERRRQAVVLITDGHDQGSLAGSGDVLLRAWAAQIPFVVLGVGEAATDYVPRTIAAEKLAAEFVAQLEALVLTAGGRFIRAGHDTPLERVFEEAFHALRSSYVLAYEPDDSARNALPQPQRIEVRSRQDAVTLVAPDVIYTGSANRTTSGMLTRDGSAELTAGRALAALDRLSRATEADPEYAAPHYLLALAAAQLGELDQAETAARRAAYLQPTAPEPQALLAEILLAAERPEEAMQSVVRAGFLGADIGPAAALLESQHGMRVDVEALTSVPKLWITHLANPDLPFEQTLARAARILMHHAGADPGTALVGPGSPANITHRLVVDAREISSDGSLRGILHLWKPSPGGRFRPEPRSNPARFTIEADELASLIGADAPDVPEGLRVAFERLWAGRRR